MNATLQNEYARQRKAGRRADTALRNAKIKREFASRDDVRLFLVWYPHNKARKDLWESIESNGVWGLTSEVKCASCDEWHHVDSCWGFIGQDEAGYEYDIMGAALDAAKKGGCK